MSLVNNLSNLINNNNKISWDEYFISSALLMSCRSPCNRLHVGCVLVKDKRIIASGYNGFLPKAPHKSIICNNHEVATVHAEQNAIADCANRGVSTNNSTAYITHYPCINCAKILAASGVISIKYLNDYRNDPNVEEILNNSYIIIKKIDKFE
jgi:dCMP deaminase